MISCFNLKKTNYYNNSSKQKTNYRIKINLMNIFIDFNTAKRNIVFTSGR